MLYARASAMEFNSLRCSERCAMRHATASQTRSFSLKSARYDDDSVITSFFARSANELWVGRTDFLQSIRNIPKRLKNRRLSRIVRHDWHVEVTKRSYS